MNLSGCTWLSTINRPNGGSTVRLTRHYPRFSRHPFVSSRERTDSLDPPISEIKTIYRRGFLLRSLKKKENVQKRLKMEIIIRAVTIKNVKLLLSLRKVAIVKNEISFNSNVKDRNVSQEL